MEKSKAPTLQVASLPTESDLQKQTLKANVGNKAPVINIPIDQIQGGQNALNSDKTLELMKAALVKVEEVLAKADQTATMLQQNITQVTNQRIGLSYQKAMLMDLIGVVEKSEKK